jgi:hypothetical protein
MFTLDIRDPIKYIKAKKKKKKCKDCEGTNKIFFFFFGKDMTKYVKNKSQRIWNKAIRTNLVSIGERQGEGGREHSNTPAVYYSQLDTTGKRSYKK